MRLPTYRNRKEATEWDRRYWRAMKNGVLTPQEYWAWRDAQDAYTPNCL